MLWIAGVVSKYFRGIHFAIKVFNFFINLRKVGNYLTGLEIKKNRWVAFWRLTEEF